MCQPLPSIMRPFLAFNDVLTLAVMHQSLPVLKVPAHASHEQKLSAEFA